MRIDGLAIPMWALVLLVLFAVYWFGFRGKR